MLTRLPPIMQVVLALLVVTAAIFDLRYRRIPNWLVLAGLLAGFGLNAFLFQMPGVKQSALGMTIGLAIYFPLYALRAMGAGDAKLMAAVGSIVGWQRWIVLFIVTAILGGLVAMIVLLFARRVNKTFWNLGWILNELRHFRAPYRSSEELDVRSAKALRMPHGAVIALASIVLLVAQARFSAIL